MDLRLQISHCDQAGIWSIKGLPGQSVARFENLSEGLAYAKRECASAPAVIELFAGGLYLVVSQKRGWPLQLCRSAGYRATGIHNTAEPVGASKSAQTGGRLWRNTNWRDIRHLFSFSRSRARASRFVAEIASAFRDSQASKKLKNARHR